MYDLSVTIPPSIISKMRDRWWRIAFIDCDRPGRAEGVRTSKEAIDPLSLSGKCVFLDGSLEYVERVVHVKDSDKRWSKVAWLLLKQSGLNGQHCAR